MDREDDPEVAWRNDVTDEGVPLCTFDRCPQYDGKRCKVLHHRPDTICEPEVMHMAKLLRLLRQGSAPTETGAKEDG